MGNEDRMSLERRIFEACLTKTPQQQSDYLRQACSGDDALEQRIKRLLAAHRRAEQSPRTKIPAAPGNQSESDPQEIGPYRILSRIGKGGMGIVYKAEQTRPVRRVVAVKLIKQGMDTREVIARFESERQALALMNHPNIARILDAGASSQGRPYFVMEYVPGEPITAYCDRHRLSVAERVNLFADVCDAVQHAHQKGIIHRDLKPSNVLVTVQGETPVPKIIDFGVAKATEFRLTDKTLHTRLGMMVGTPEYMSPEQAEMTGLDIDTRSDVYSLGVILYKLLCGALPFDSSTLAFAEVSRLIRQVDPPRPSLRAVGLEEARRSAGNRRTDPKGLARQLRGDLDWIVMKALDKDRTRRFPSASDLALDLRRHMAMEPVMAGPPSAAYRLGKFARKHRGSLAAACLLLLVLLGGIIGTTAGLLRARSQAEQAGLQAAIAEAVNEYLNEDILSAVDPEKQGIDVTMREVLEAASRQVDEKFQDQPLVEAAVRSTIGNTYRNLGEFSSAERHLGKALELRRRHRGANHQETLRSLIQLAGLYYDQSRFEECADLSLQAYQAGMAAFGPRHRLTLDSAQRLATTYIRQSRLDEAEKLLLDSLKVRREAFPPADPGTQSAMNGLGNVYWYKGDYEQAARWYRETLALRREVLGQEHPSTLISMNNLGMAYRQLGRLEEAQQIISETLEARRRVLGADHPRTITTLTILANIYWEWNRLSAARDLYREAYQLRRPLLGAEHEDTLGSMFNLGMASLHLGDLEEADRLLSEALAVRRRVLGDGHRLTIKTMRELGDLRTRQKRYRDAGRLLQESLSKARLSLGDDHFETLDCRHSLATLYNAQGRHSQARLLVQEALQMADLQPSEQWELERCRIQLGVALAGLGEPARAEQVLLQAQLALEKSKGDSSLLNQLAIQALVDFYRGQGQSDKLAQWVSRLDQTGFHAKPQSRKETAK